MKWHLVITAREYGRTLESTYNRYPSNRRSAACMRLLSIELTEQINQSICRSHTIQSLIARKIHSKKLHQYQNT